MHTINGGFLMRLCFARYVNMSVAAILVGIMSASTIADTRFLPDGQANVAGQFDNLNLDLSGRASADDQRSGVRLSLPRFSEHFVLFADAHSTRATLNGIAFGDEVDVSGRARGGGIYITGLPDWRSYTLNLRLSGQSETLDVDSNIVVSGIQARTRFDNRNVSVALLLSPVNSPFSNGANVYMTLGASYHRSRRTVSLNGQEQPSLSRYEQTYVPQLAAGLVYPFKRLRLYASVDYEEELALGLGIRLQLSKTGSR